MLTSSPIAPRPANASPRTFYYAAASTAAAASSATHLTRSPHHSPRSPRVIAPLSRRHSKTTIAQPSPQESPRSSKQYVGVDAATQYSPMEPFDPTVPLRPGPSQAGPRRPRPTTTTVTTVTHLGPPPAVLEPPSEPSISPAKPEDPRTNALSPGKRRKSHDIASAHSSSVVAASQPSSPKRSKPNQGPPKLLPLRYELCDVEDMVILIANMLGELIETNDSIAMKSGQLTRFHSRTAPDFTINTLTVHRFLITAATVAGKGLSDSFWNNSFYARVGGVKVAELKLLELEFLYRVDWKIVPNPEVLVAYYKGLVERCDGYILEGDETPGEEADDEKSDETDAENGSDLPPKDSSSQENISD
ncbi:hypothetical protein DL766_003439 [Monosporascus sp. MC13-8B]|uniref:Cyclin N-terminal domain-containing protein n=1 Tax=Monosporascus cannonballus TaxID=155416 RepID=A0ABY0HKM0_9PEZI|nr:hypothetical protein DL763_006655 [Monosporascus cannonballus]RYO92735.1 hypothetical protein DL762_001441 [Monosporascus cannonballus]RYP33519.1 hypothetical protein DL766_003439 [Monosporascus sp. MC13-8B]